MYMCEEAARELLMVDALLALLFWFISLVVIRLTTIFNGVWESMLYDA